MIGTRIGGFSRSLVLVSNGNPLVSVIVRTRNRPDLLAQAVASVSAQDYRPLELVVVNDGGYEVSSVLTGVEERGVLLVPVDLDPVRGRCGAANAGIAAARGSWVAFLDDDDILLPGSISFRVQSTRPNLIPYGEVNAYRWTSQGFQLFKSFAQPFDRNLLLFENFIPICAPLLPADGLHAAGGFDVQLECFEDWDLFLRLSDSSDFELIRQPAAEYRIFEESAFIDGKGGIEAQIRGLETFFAKHHGRFGPEALARMQVAVKTHIFPGVNEERHAALEQESARLRRALAHLASRHSPPRDIAIVITNFNGKHHLQRCLPAIRRTCPDGVQIVVVDNASKDGSVAWLRQEWPEITLVPLEENVGFGAGNLRGVESARGRWVVLLNSDTVPAPGWLEPLLQAVAGDEEVAAACSVLRLLEYPDLINARGGGMSKLGYGLDHDFQYAWEHPWRERTQGPAEVLFPTAAAMAMERTTFLEVGGFDPAMFMYHEDVDLGWRLWLLGRRVVVCPDSVVGHAFLGTSGPSRGLDWRARLGLRHNIRSLLVHYEAPNLARALIGLARMLLQERAFGLALHVALWNLRRLPDTLTRRRALQKGRVRSDRELFQRGLISGQPMPPAPPERPVPATTTAEAIRSPLLLPAEHSALGRLGSGWFPPELVNGKPARWTSGTAFARLHVAPEIRGRLEVEVFRPSGVAGEARATLQTGHTEATIFAAPGHWTQASLPCRSDSEGVISIAISASEISCHDHWKAWDARMLGIAIHAFRFVPDRIETLRAPASLAVIIPTYNRWHYLKETLEALCGQTRLPDEVIVVDDGSTDGTFERLQTWQRQNVERLPLTILHQENARQGAARNLALRNTKSDLILLLGDDMVPDPGCVDCHLEAHRQLGPGVAILGLIDWHEPGVRVTPFLRFVHLDGAQFAFGHMTDGADLPFTNFYTSNISLEREVLGVDPFDPAFTSYGWEDIEIGWRLSLRGLRIVHRAGARVRHRHPMSLRGFVNRQRQVGSSIETLYALRPELRGNRWLPHPHPPRRWRIARQLFPILLPMLAAADSCSLPLPWRLYREMVHWAFYEGVSNQKGLGKKGW